MIGNTTYRRNDEGDWFEMETEYRNRMTFQSEQDMLDEIARLRAAGDALARNYAAQLSDVSWSAFNNAFYIAWQEARREQ